MGLKEPLTELGKQKSQVICQCFSTRSTTQVHFALLARNTSLLFPLHEEKKSKKAEMLFCCCSPSHKTSHQM